MEDLMELYFSEKDVVKRHNLLKAIIFANKLCEAVMKVPKTTPYAYNLYEDMRAAYLLPYLVKTYNYQCFIDLYEQVEKQYEAMPDVFKNIYSYDENGEFYQIRDPKEVKKSMDDFGENKRS